MTVSPFAQGPEPDGLLDGDAELQGVNLTALQRYIAQVTPELLGDSDFSAAPFASGRSNLTFRLTGPRTELVLRRPPLGDLLPTAHDMGREFRVQHALHAAGFPVPRPVLYCADTNVIGASFYLMEFVDGVGLHTPSDFVGLPAVVNGRMADELMTTLASLHTVDPADAGLREFGNPDGFVQRQVTRWTGHWAKSKTRELPAMDMLAHMLNDGVAGLPPSVGSIVHGDFRLENTLLHGNDDPRIKAVLDWELSTLGDPMTDLGFTLSYWRPAGGPILSEEPETQLVGDGWPTVAEMADIYCKASGYDISHLDFYRVLALFKVAVIFEGIHARYLANHTVGAGFDEFGARVPHLVDQALDIAASSSLPTLRS